MSILATIRETVEAACGGYSFQYDVRSMENVRADDASFPMVWMEEYYQSRLSLIYGWRREYTLTLHFLNLVPMHGDAEDNEDVREQMMHDAVLPFIEKLRETADVSELDCSPERPQFDATATGLRLSFRVSYPVCR